VASVVSWTGDSSKLIRKAANTSCPQTVAALFGVMYSSAGSVRRGARFARSLIRGGLTRRDDRGRNFGKLFVRGLGLRGCGRLFGVIHRAGLRHASDAGRGVVRRLRRGRIGTRAFRLGRLDAVVSVFTLRASCE